MTRCIALVAVWLAFHGFCVLAASVSPLIDALLATPVGWLAYGAMSLLVGAGLLFDA